MAKAPDTQETSPQAAPGPARRYRIRRGHSPPHGDLARSAGVTAQLADERYVEALACIVYYWGPAVDIMAAHEPVGPDEEGAGRDARHFPAAPVNTTGCLRTTCRPPSAGS